MKSLDEYLRSCQEPTVWEVGNQTLYDLCATYPTHTDPSQIVAKTWLIGRSYSVALERRKGATESNEVYYREKIPHAFISSKLDDWLLTLPVDKGLTTELFAAVIKIHADLVDHLKNNLDRSDEKEGLNRISFCSKYLHFHQPLLFPIYDARAVKGLRILLKSYPLDPPVAIPYPAQYDRFCEAVLAVVKKFNPRLTRPLTLRQVDNLLLQLAEGK